VEITDKLVTIIHNQLDFIYIRIQMQAASGNALIIL
jgi:hypothetical protein